MAVTDDGSSKTHYVAIFGLVDAKSPLGDAGAEVPRAFGMMLLRPEKHPQ